MRIYIYNASGCRVVFSVVGLGGFRGVEVGR